MNVSAFKPTLLAIALPCAAVLPAQAARAAATAHAVATVAPPAWVATSNRYAQILLAAQGPFQPLTELV